MRSRYVVMVATVGLLGACSSSPNSGAPPVSTPGPTTSSTPASAATPTPTLAAARGSRANPLAPGEARKIAIDSAFTVSGGATDFDAWPEVKAENQFNEAPKEGRSFVMAPISVTVDWPTALKQAADSGGSLDGGLPVQFALTAAFVGTDGLSYGSNPNDHCGVAPNDWSNLNSVFDSATVTGSVCVSVPTAVAQGGTWVVTNNNNNAVFVSAQ